MKSEVIIKFCIPGFHYYPEAPTEVSFLQHRHRHTFNIECGYKVIDLDREKEIFIYRDIVIEYLTESYGYPCEFKNMSCEMIAKEILEFGIDDGMIWAEVREEETGGARVSIN